MNEREPLPVPTTDEIDLIDLMRTIWDLRFFWVAGAVLSVVATLTLLPFVLPTRYVAKLNVAVDITSLPALSAPEEVTKKINEQLGTERADRVLTESVLAEFPELARYKDDMNLLFEGRLAQSPKDLPVSLAAKVGTNHFLATVTLPARPGQKGNMHRALTKGLNALVAQANQDEELVHRSQVSSSLESARTVNASTSAILRESQSGLGDLVDIMGKIQTVAYALESKAAALSPSARQFLGRLDSSPESQKAAEPAPKPERSADTILYQRSNEWVSRSFTILGLLSDEKKISTTERNSMRAELIALQGQLDAAYTERSTFQRLIEDSTTHLSEALRISTQPIDRSKSFLPQFRAPDLTSAGSAAQQGTANTAEEPTPDEPLDSVLISAKPSRALSVALALFIGSILGALIGFVVKVLPKAFRARQLAASQA